MELKIHHDSEKNQFFADLGEDRALLNYRKLNDQTLDYKSTFVPEEKRNQGIGSELVRYALDWARDNNYVVKPSCPFVAQFIEQNPDYQSVTT